MTICDTGLCEGRDYEVVLQFEASPEPGEVSILTCYSVCEFLFFLQLHSLLFIEAQKDKLKSIKMYYLSSPRGLDLSAQVEWVMRAHESRQRTVVRAGDRRKTYDADRLEDISTRSSPDR